MEVHLQPEKEAELARLAAQHGLDAGAFAETVLVKYLEDDRNFLEAVNAGLAAADRGDFVEHDQVVQRVKEILRS
jgi:predicted transcriptional regulator